MLVDFLNDDTDPYQVSREEVGFFVKRSRYAVQQFLKSFDGSPDAAHLVIWRDREARPSFMPAPRPVLNDPDWLERLQMDLNLVLDALDEDSPIVPVHVWLQPRRNRADQHRSKLLAEARRAYEAPGAFVMHVGGELHDVVIYCVLQLLMAPGMAGRLARCPAHTSHSSDERCRKWFVEKRLHKKWCSDACKMVEFRRQK